MGSGGDDCSAVRGALSLPVGWIEESVVRACACLWRTLHREGRACLALQVDLDFCSVDPLYDFLALKDDKSDVKIIPPLISQLYLIYQLKAVFDSMLLCRSGRKKN